MSARASYDAEQRRNALRDFLQGNALSARALCSESGLSPSALAQFLRRNNPSRTLTDETYELLAFGASRLLSRKVTAAELRGQFLASARRLLVDLELRSAGYIEQYREQPTPTAPAPPGFEEGGSAIRVQTEEFFPLFEAGDVLYYEGQSPLPSLVGRVAAVKVRHGPFLLRRVMRLVDNRTATLMSIGERAAPVLDDHQLDWGSPISWVWRPDTVIGSRPLPH